MQTGVSLPNSNTGRSNPAGQRCRPAPPSRRRGALADLLCQDGLDGGGVRVWLRVHVADDGDAGRHNRGVVECILQLLSGRGHVGSVEGTSNSQAHLHTHSDTAQHRDNSIRDVCPSVTQGVDSGWCPLLTHSRGTAAQGLHNCALAMSLLSTSVHLQYRPVTTPQPPPQHPGLCTLTVMRALKAGSLPSLSTASQPSMLPLTA